jgi:hypothetical protein
MPVNAVNIEAGFTIAATRTKTVLTAPIYAAIYAAIYKGDAPCQIIAAQPVSTAIYRSLSGQKILLDNL